MNQPISLNQEIDFCIVIPLMNEEENINDLYKQIKNNTKNFKIKIIFVDDGSTDKSKELIIKLSKISNDVIGVFFTRNFGSHFAIAAGLGISKNYPTIIMAADLQDPPELLPKIFYTYKENKNLVFSVRKKRDESFFKKFFASIFYKTLRLLNIKFFQDLNTDGFGIYPPKVIDSLLKLNERTRITPYLIYWLGYKIDTIEYDRPNRIRGKSKWPFLKRLFAGLNIIFSFSNLPLRAFFFTGLLTNFFSILLIIKLFYEYFILGYNFNGWASIICLILFFGGLNLLVVGVLGEYIAQINEETKKRPLYVIEETINL